MPVFAVVAHTNPSALKSAVVAQYGANHYEFSPSVWFVSDAGSSKTVADKLGVTNGAFGGQAVILTFTAYSGFGPATAWSWLAQHPEAISNG